MLILEENSQIKGEFQARIYRKGKLVETIHESNLIVNGAKNQMARLVAGEFQGRNISKIAFGTNGTDPVLTDTIITNQFAKAISSYSFREGRILIEWELLVSENNGMPIMEFGLLTADGTLFSRKTRSNPIVKESDISIEGQWVIYF